MENLKRLHGMMKKANLTRKKWSLVGNDIKVFNDVEELVEEVRNSPNRRSIGKGRPMLASDSLEIII